MIKKVSHSIEKEILEAFNKKAKENALNKSKWVQMKMQEYIGGLGEIEVQATQIRNLVSYINSLELELKEKEGKK